MSHRESREPAPDRSAVGAAMPKAIPFDRIAGAYDTLRGGDKRAERLATPMLKYLSRGIPTLDIGIGTGTVAQVLGREGIPVAGVELSPAMASQAVPRTNGNVLVADAAQLPLLAESFDQAVSVWLFHVVPDVLKVLSQAARVLRVGACYVIIPGRTLPPPQPLAREVWDMFSRLDPTGKRDDGAGLRRYAHEAGFDVLHEGIASQHEVMETPQEVTEAIMRRDFPLLWDLPSDLWEQQVEPLLATLRAQSDPAVARPRTIIHEILVLQRRPMAL